eukprot:s1180_g3.t1
MTVAKEARKLGIEVAWEWSQRCQAWNLPEYLAFSEAMGMHTGICNGCQVNLRDREERLLCKAWRVDSTWPELSKHLNLRCSGQHKKGVCTGNVYYTAFYTPEFAKRLVRFIAKSQKEAESHLAWEWAMAGEEQQEEESHEGGDQEGGEGESEEAEAQAGLERMSREEKERVIRLLRKIHSSTGHCSNQHLVQHLKRQNASPAILRLARDLSCDVCREWSRPSPRPQSTLHPISRKWETLIMDCGYWRNQGTGKSWLFILAVDEGSRLRVGRVIREGSRAKINADDVKQFLEEQWLSVFGVPSVIRTDAESPLRGLQLDGWLREKGVLLEHVPPEAHWQISPVERSVQSTKDIMWKLSSEYTDMSCRELFCRALWAQNHRDLYLGYSPLQHAFGRAPQDPRGIGDQSLLDLPILTEAGVSAEHGTHVEAMRVAETAFLENQAKERLKRASQAGHRKMKHFCPGDLVYAWRKVMGRADGNKGFASGRFVGPFRVLATETRVDGERVQPGQCVWIYRGNRLTRAAPQQLRPATPREEAWNEITDPRKEIPWTIHEMLSSSAHKVFDDAIPEASEMPDLVDLGEDDVERQPPAHRLRRKTRDEAPVPERPPRSSDSDGPRDRARSRSPAPKEEPARSSHEPAPKQARANLADVVSDPSHLSLSPCSYWQKEDASVEIGIDLPAWGTGKHKQMMRDMSAFMVRQIRRQNIEVSERRLSEKEKEEFKAAKGKEVNNYIASKVFSVLPAHLQPDPNQAMQMRWVLTWKFGDEGKKAKARCVSLGFQDPQYEHRPTASPTMSRSTRQIFLQCCANRGFKVYKGDVSGAFLQGRTFKREMFCIPVPEICEALGVPANSIMRLNKAAYGLVEAPLEWFLTICDFLSELGFERQYSDPCCWALFDTERQPIGYICGHVDDFLFGGRDDDERWKTVVSRIKERFKWQEWECDHFTQCGVMIRQDAEGFTLQQEHFLDEISEIHIPAHRYHQQDHPITDGERQQMRSVLGCLSWYAYQTGYHLIGPVGLLLSKVSKALVSDLSETNKLLKKARTMRSHKVRIHKQEEEPFVACWVDASYANRPDGSSTKGMVIGWTSPKLSQGALSKVSPLSWVGSKIHRVCRSPASAETRAAVDGEDELFAIRLQIAEFLGYKVDLRNVDASVRQIPAALISDSKCLYDRLQQTALTLKGEEKRSDIEPLCLKEAMETTALEVRWVHGDAQLANSLTKDSEYQQILLFQSLGGRWRITYDVQLMRYVGARRGVAAVGETLLPTVLSRRAAADFLGAVHQDLCPRSRASAFAEADYCMVVLAWVTEASLCFVAFVRDKVELGGKGWPAGQGLGQGPFGNVLLRMVLLRNNASSDGCLPYGVEPKRSEAEPWNDILVRNGANFHFVVDA